MFRELEAVGSHVGMSVLCPGAVATGIVNSAKHWPDRLGPAPAPLDDVSYPQLDELMSSQQVAAITFEGIAARRFWILTHRAQFASAMRARIEGAVSGENPDESTVDPNWKKETGRVPGLPLIRALTTAAQADPQISSAVSTTSLSFAICSLERQ